MLSIDDKKSRSEIIVAINRLHNLVSRGERKIKLDFSSTSKIYSTAMILIYAEVSNLINLHSDIKLSCTRPRNSKASHVLYQIGMYKKCPTRFTPKQNYGDVIHWRVCSGVDVIGKNYDIIVNHNNELFDPEVDLYGGCIEATKNVKRHAYLEERELSPVAHEKTGWWIFSQIKDGAISVCVCDLGCSIPVTLPKRRKGLFENILKLGTSSDHDLIQGAIGGAQSRSLESYRGNGLPKIAQVASQTAGASLAIHSRNGYLRVANGTSVGKKRKTPIQGTIISWTLPLEGRNE
jgi:hypothetical protein